MSTKRKRIMWLLNHRTLMEYEADLLERLGYEVFVPKIIPSSGFRSGGISHRFDAALTIPSAALDVLNAFDFHQASWPPHVAGLVNKYFGTVFAMPYGRSFAEVADCFSGTIVLRAFGQLDVEGSYASTLQRLFGTALMRRVAALGDRFWFGEAYDNLHDHEPVLLAQRALHLPIGVPSQTFAHRQRWDGSDRRVLFLCPDVATSAHYRRWYESFKTDFGDLPHVIIGAQHSPVDDPHVRGFITTDELYELYRTSSVLYYPSTESRHVHYTPVEAAIVGQPVVFHAHSQLDRLSHPESAGRVQSVQEARVLVEQLLSGDAATVASVRKDQDHLAQQFDDAACSEIWSRNLSRLHDATPPRPRPRPRPRRSVPSGQDRRCVLELDEDQAEIVYGSSLRDGLLLSQDLLPAFVAGVDGLDVAERWGRWSTGDAIVIHLRHRLSGCFGLFVRAAGFGPNVGRSASVTIGRQTRALPLTARFEEVRGHWLSFELGRPADSIVIEVPHPTRPACDERSIGIALAELTMSKPPRTSLATVRATGRPCAVDGVHFGSPRLPRWIERTSGLGEPEGWGRWSTSRAVTISLRHTLHGEFDLLLDAVAYEQHTGPSAIVRIGDVAHPIDVPVRGERRTITRVRFSVPRPEHVITFEMLHPQTPPNDPRTVDLAFYALRVEPRSSA